MIKRMVPKFKVEDVGANVDTAGNEVRRIYDGIAATVVELVKTPFTVIADIDDIIDVCFVFDLDNIEDGHVFGLGIRNCYLCRYYYLPDNQRIEPFKLEESFASDNPLHTSSRRCTSSILWYSICALQDVIWKSLNRYAERQENWSKVKCNMNDTLWDYLIHRTNGLVNQVTTKSPGIIRNATLMGIERVSKRVPQTTHCLRFETKEQLLCLRKIFGDSALIGLRRRRPKLNTSDRIEPLTKVNIIVGKQSNEDSIPEIHRSRSSRIEFFFNDFESFICLYYEDFILSANAQRLTNTATQQNIIND